MKAIAASERLEWRDARNPGQLFLRLWKIASTWDPADRSIAPDVSLGTRQEFARAVAENGGREAVAALLDEQDQIWPKGDTRQDHMEAAGVVLATMRAIDTVFQPSHPRSRTVSPRFAAPTVLPAWLDAINLRRLRFGSFAEADDQRLIPNGPFARHARGRDASAGDSLRDRFAVLTVAPNNSKQEDREITINIKVIGTDIMRGVPASPSLGRERIRFIPLAEEIGDFTYLPSKRDEHPVLDVRPNVDTPGRLLAALANGSDIDIAFSPELVMPGQADQELSDGIAALAANAPRIILAGSGLTVETSECGRSWNEARVFARGGRLLWRHRKMWPFGMQSGSAVAYGFPDPGQETMLMEDIAASSTVCVVDMDGFGRCVVLICQDFQSRPLVDEIVTRYQPDWVLTPVLDPGVKVPGWAHQRCEALSKLSQARLVVGSSLAMSHLGALSGNAEPPIAIAVGPSDPHPAAGEPTRALAVVWAAAGSTPRSGLLVWDYAPGAWTKTNVGATP